MATVAFEGTSLMNMFVQNCWVVGTQRIISHRGEEEFIEVRTELSDRSVLYLHRTDRDLGSLLKRLVDSFPEDRTTPTQSALLDGLVRIRDAAEANDIEIRLQEVEKLLRRVITLPIKYSRSEAVLTFFEQSPLDLMIRENNINNMEPYYQSPVTISASVPLLTSNQGPSAHINNSHPRSIITHHSTKAMALAEQGVQLLQGTSAGIRRAGSGEGLGGLSKCLVCLGVGYVVAACAQPASCALCPQLWEATLRQRVARFDIMRCNGFCLANTETIFYDYSAPQNRHRALSVSTCTESVGFGYDTQSGFKETLDLVETASTDGSAEDQETSFPNLTYYQLLTYETDILE